MARFKVGDKVRLIPSLFEYADGSINAIDMHVGFRPTLYNFKDYYEITNSFEHAEYGTVYVLNHENWFKSTHIRLRVYRNQQEIDTAIEELINA